MITNIANIGMNYTNYKTTIIQKHHVQLLGWPSIPFVNPHMIMTVATINSLHHALTIATCKWVVLMKHQQKEHTATMAKDFEDNPVVGKKHKVQTDKGKKQKAVAPTDSDEGGLGEEQDERSQIDEDNNSTAPLPPPAPKKKRKVLPKALSSKMLWFFTSFSLLLTVDYTQPYHIAAFSVSPLLFLYLLSYCATCIFHMFFIFLLFWLLHGLHMLPMLLSHVLPSFCI